MKCKHVLQRLLATSGPRRLGDDVLAHLDGCERCRKWADRLTEIDHAVPQVAVPDSGAAKAALMHRFLNEPAPVPGSSWRWRDLKISWAHVAAAVAALLLIGVMLNGMFQGGSGSREVAAADPLLKSVLDRHLELAAADSVEKRVDILEKLSNDLDEQTRTLARVAPAEDLDELANLYVTVVNGDKGLVKRADDVPGVNKQKLLESMASRMRDVANRADRMAGEVPPAAAPPLKKIAAAARDAHGTLGRKAREEKLAQDRIRNERLAQEAPPQRGEGKS